MSDRWAWFAVYFLPYLPLGVLIRELRQMRRERDTALLALRLNVARQMGEEMTRDLLAKWERHCQVEGLDFDDGDEAAHAFADFLANATGQPIIAQQLDGEGIVVAIPDEEQHPDA